MPTLQDPEVLRAFVENRRSDSGAPLPRPLRSRAFDVQAKLGESRVSVYFDRVLPASTTLYMYICVLCVVCFWELYSILCYIYKGEGSPNVHIPGEQSCEMIFARGSLQGAFRFIRRVSPMASLSILASFWIHIGVVVCAFVENNFRDNVPHVARSVVE